MKLYLAYDIVDHNNQGEEVKYLADVVKRVVLSLGKGGSSSAAGWEGLQCDNFLYNKIMFDKHIFDQTQANHSLALSLSHPLTSCFEFCSDYRICQS